MARRTDYIAKRKVFDQALYDAIVSAPSDAVALDRAKAIVRKGVAEKIIDSERSGNAAPGRYPALGALFPRL